MVGRFWIGFCFLWAMIAGDAACADIIFIAPTNLGMPLVQFSGGMLTGGILKDLGEAIGRKIGQNVRFVSIPGKRVARYLASGDADGVCYVLPEWIGGDFNWSRTVITDHGIVVSQNDAPPIHAVKELADQRVGTISGYSYPEIDAALGAHFDRDDSETMEANLKRISAGRLKYGIAEQLTFDYLRRLGKIPLLRNDLVVRSYSTQCAFSTRSRIRFADLDAAVSGLIKDGSVDQILSLYR